MADNNKLCIGVIVVLVLAAAGLFFLGGNSDTGITDTTTTDTYDYEESIFYSNDGKVSPKSSDLTLYYNNDESIYGYFDMDGNFKGIAYYNDAIIKGTVKINLKKVKWDDNTDKDYAKANATKDIKKALKDGDLEVTMSFEDKKGHSVDLYDLTTETGEFYDEEGDYEYEFDEAPLDVSMKKSVITVDVDYRFTINSTPISNAPPYDGDLAKEPSDFDKTYKAILTFHTSEDDYSYDITSTLKGDNFNVVHM